MAFGSSRLIVLILLVAVAPSCTKVKARTPDPDPGLSTPSPPDRVIVPVVLPEPVEPPPPPAPTPPPSADPRQTVRRDRPAAPAAATPPAAPETPPSPPPVLQTTLDTGELEQQANTLISVAKKDLDRVPLQQLSANAREQYDRAQGFIRQAQAALKIKNVAVAKELADKAASLASQLPKR